MALAEINFCWKLYFISLKTCSRVRNFCPFADWSTKKYFFEEPATGSLTEIQQAEGVF